jgi:hypothetical protein
VARGFPGDHRIRDCVGMALVGVTRLIDAALQLDAATLLNDVRSFVRCGVQIRRRTKRDGVAERVRRRTELVRGRRRSSAVVGLHARDVMMTEACLDAIEMRQRSTGSGDPATGDLVDVCAIEHRIVGAIRRRALDSSPLDRFVRSISVAALPWRTLHSAVFATARTRGRGQNIEDRGRRSNVTLGWTPAFLALGVRSEAPSSVLELFFELCLNGRYASRCLLDKRSPTHSRFRLESLPPRARLEDATVSSVASATLTLVHGAHHNDRGPRGAIDARYEIPLPVVCAHASSEHRSMSHNYIPRVQSMGTR